MQACPVCIVSTNKTCYFVNGHLAMPRIPQTLDCMPLPLNTERPSSELADPVGTGHAAPVSLQLICPRVEADWDHMQTMTSLDHNPFRYEPRGRVTTESKPLSGDKSPFILGRR